MEKYAWIWGTAEDSQRVRKWSQCRRYEKNTTDRVGMEDETSCDHLGMYLFQNIDSLAFLQEV